VLLVVYADVRKIAERQGTAPNPACRTWPKSNADWWRAKIKGNITRDRDTDSGLIDAGWTVLRVWEHESVQLAADRIEAAVRSAKGHGETDLLEMHKFGCSTALSLPRKLILSP
jgi:hypothetical protein